MENYSNNVGNDQEKIEYRNVINFFWRLRYWIVFSVALSLICAFVFVRVQTPVFQREAWLMLNNNDGSNSEISLLADLTGRSVRKKVDDEVFILKSPSLMSKVVRELNLNKRYFEYRMPIADRISVGRSLLASKKHELYNNSPFMVVMAPDSVGTEAGAMPSAFSLEFQNHKNTSFSVKGMVVGGTRIKLKGTDYKYGEPLPVPGMSVYVTVTDPALMRNNNRYGFSYSDPFKAAQSFLRNLTVSIDGNKNIKGNEVTLTYQDAIPARAEDILNALFIENNRQARDYANVASVNTVNFIDQRLSELATDLGAAEGDFKRYQTSNAVVNLESQGQLAMNTDMNYQNQLVEVRLQQRVLDMISDYLDQNNSGEYKVIPSNIGISDVGLNSIIANYNGLVAERNRLVANSSETNPRVLSLNSQLLDSKNSIEISISNLVNVYKIREKDLEETLSASRRKMAQIPQQQFEVQQLSRKIDIIEPLYLMLQQKREEAQIAMYSQSDNFRLVEAAFGSNVPVSPKSRNIYLLAFLLGLCLPAAIVWLRMQLKTKVETKKDVTDVVKAEVIAVLPRMDKDQGGELISKNSRDSVSESFRMLRANLQYMPGVKVVQVTSSTPGEGKSYVASNLAVSISHTGKKVLLVGMDIRKPVLRKLFPEVKPDNSRSVVGYLIGRWNDVSTLPVPSGLDDNLDVLFAGPVPPNPTELLSQDGVKAMIDSFRGMYDYVVIDSAPYLPVSDSGLINSHVDATLYVVRAGTTTLNILPEVNEALFNPNQPIKRPNIVLNDLDLSSKRYQYGYGYGYGAGYGYGSKAGYGYGYGYGYGNDDNKK